MRYLAVVSLLALAPSIHAQIQKETFEQMLRAHPAMLTLVPGSAVRGTFWYVSTVAVAGFGYFAGVLSGNGMAHLAVTYGWQTMFLVLAGVAGLTSFVGGLALWQQHRRAIAIGLLRPAEGQ